jgi:hypothetical protein
VLDHADVYNEKEEDIPDSEDGFEDSEDDDAPDGDDKIDPPVLFNCPRHRPNDGKDGPPIVLTAPDGKTVLEPDDDKFTCKRKDLVGKLADTLFHSPHLGRHVRRIILGTWIHDRDTTECHIQILKRCPFVEDVKIWGYSGHLVKKYKGVLAELRNLRTLNINCFSLADYESTHSIMSDEQFLGMLKGWPRLEQVRVPTDPYYSRIESKHEFLAYCTERGIEMSTY